MDAMGPRTRAEQRIEQALLELVTARSVDKITVKDITERAQVSRRAFYMYYRDLPDVMERILTQSSQNLIRRSLAAEDTDEILSLFFEEMDRGYPVLSRVLDSRFRAGAEHRLLETVKTVITAILRQTRRDVPLSVERAEVLVDLLSCMTLGYLLEHYGKRDFTSAEMRAQVTAMIKLFSQRHPDL